MTDRPRPRLLLALALAAIPAVAPAQPPTKPGTVEITVSPKAAPADALRYRLLPLESERTPGNAVPMYLRAGMEIPEDRLKEIDKKSDEYLDEPIATLPVAEARKFVDSWSFRLDFLTIGARRRVAEWDYPLTEQREDAISILLPDVQGMRRWTRLVAIKARVEIAEKKYDDAVRTIETGLGLARHIAEGPFIINGLVGVASANIALGRAEELIAQPDAPNLYWALTALPRPLVDLRKGMDTEQAMGGFVLPELLDADAPRTEAEWASRLARLHARWNRLAKLIVQGEGNPEKPPTFDPDFAKFRAAILPEARSYLKERRGSIDGIGEDQAIVLYIAGVHRELRDAVFRPYYLPFPEATPLYEAADSQRKAMSGEVVRMMSLLAPAIRAAHGSEVRLDRRVAALRAIEAVRMQAAANGGKFPKALAEVKVVPVPNDPVTNRPFEYRAEDGAFTLEGPPAPGNVTILQYRITPR